MASQHATDVRLGSATHRDRVSWLPVCALLLAVLVPGAEASIATGPFTNGVPWFTSPLGSGVDKPTGPGDKIVVDTDGDGLPDTDFDLPAELVPSADVDFEYRLSPSQSHLYVTKFNPGGSGFTSVCGGFPYVEVHLYSIEGPPSLIPFSLSGGGTSCVVAPLAKQPAFYDQSGPTRTMVLVGAADSAGPGQHQVLWADLIGRQMRIDTTTFFNGVGQVAIQFAPAGNAAFVTHGFSTIQKHYTFVDLCADPLGTVTTTQDLPPSGVPSARVIVSGSDFVAELLLDGIPEPGSQVTLSTACSPTGPVACCRPGVGCTDGLTAAECVDLGGAAEAGTCSTVDCEEGCCVEGSCTVAPTSDCSAAGGTPQGTFNCSGIFCPQLTQACCVPQGYCVDTTLASCLNDFNGMPLGAGTNCYVPSPVVCPALALSVTKSGPTQVREGVPFDYTIDYENTGDLLAPGAVLRDFLPTGWLEFVAASNGGQENAGQVEWNLGDLTVGQAGQVTLTVRPSCGTTYVDNTASAESSGLQFWSNTPMSVVDRDSAPVDVQVLAVGQNGLPVEGGQLVTLTFRLTETSGSPRPGIRFNIDLDAGMNLESVLDAAGGQVATSSAQSWEWTGDLPAHTTVDVVVTARVNSCIQQKQVGLKTVIVTSACNRELARFPHVELPVRRRVEVELLATNLLPPATLENRTVAETMQLLRHGATLDLRLTAMNPHATPIASATISALVPFGYDPVGNPPFIAPTVPGATWNATTRRVSWTGSIAAQATVTISFRVVHLGDDGGMSLTGYGVAGTCTVFANSTLVPVPLPPSLPYLLALKLGQLTTFRPGIDTQAQPLFAYPNDFLNNERMARAANGDIWVAGPPVFRLNPDTLELEGLPLDLIDDLEFVPWDIAVDPNSGRVIFIGNKLAVDGTLIGLRIREYDPTTGTLYPRYASPDEDPLSVGSNIQDLMVADPWSGVAFNTGRIVYRHAGGDPDPLTPGNRPSVTSLALDGDGSYLLTGQGCCPAFIRMEDLATSGGETQTIVDLAPLTGPLFSPASTAAGDAGDIYVSSSADGLYVVHRQPGVSVDTILPDVGAGSPMLDILWVSDACVDGDGDGAGIGVGCPPSEIDCDDENADVHPGAPEINDGVDNQCLGDPGGGVVDELEPTVRFDRPAGETDLYWDAQQGATEYEVVRASVRDFSTGCSSLVTPDPHWVDPDSPSLGGEVWYYLVRPFSPFTGSFGKRTGGIERVFTCP